MAGPNVIAAFYGGTGRNNILSQTLASGTETEFKAGTDTGTNPIAVLAVPTQSQILGSQTPTDLCANPAVLNGGFSRIAVNSDSNPPFNSGVFDNSKPFLVRICGTVTPASNVGNTYQIKLYLGTSKSGTAVAQTSAVAVATTTSTYGFILEAQLIWDSTSTSVRGQMWYNGNGTTPAYASWAALTSSAGTAAAVANLQFCASMTWGNAVGGVAAVSEFSLSQL